MPAPSVRTLRGGCQCGRNLYIIQPPPDAAEAARLLFDPAPSHRASLASPLPSYIRVPLAWYHSTTLPFFPDETPAMIHRAYEHPASGPSSATRRSFCGFCGTPLSFWSEAPRAEADYIRLALGSLIAEDLDELDEWADDDISDEEGEDEDEEDEEEREEEEEEETQPAVKETTKRSAKASEAPLGRIASSTGIPWFDSFVEGSRLGRRLLQQQQQQQRLLQLRQQGGSHIRRHDAGSAKSADGTVQVEWEVLEWTEGDDEDEDDDEGGNESETGQQTGGKASGKRSSEPSPAKRARLGADDDDGPPRGKPAGAMDVDHP